MEFTYSAIPATLQKLKSNKVRIPLGLSLLLGLYPIFCESIVMSAIPRWISGWVSGLWEIIAGLIVIGLILVVFVSPIFILFRKTRPFALNAFICCCVALLFFLPSMVASRLIRMNGFEELGKRSKPLIAAIEKFEKEKGHAPNLLSELVPEYLPAVPNTGIGAYPNYEYTTLKNERDKWQLTVSCSVGLLNWDEFFYLPSKVYEKRYGGWIEPVGDWAYFHE